MCGILTLGNRFEASFDPADRFHAQRYFYSDMEFLIKVRNGEQFANVKARVQKMIGVADKEFEKVGQRERVALLYVYVQYVLYSTRTLCVPTVQYVYIIGA